MHDPSRVRMTGPLMPYANGFRVELARKGYAPGSAEFQLRLAAHLSRWLVGQNLRLDELTREHVQRFVEARQSSGYMAYRSERSLAPLLGYLRRLKVVPEPTTMASTPLEELLEDYRDYLVHERGVGVSVNRYLAVARRFLGERASVAELGLESLAAVEIRRFVLRECDRGFSVSYSRNLVAALRSLLRYLHVRGATPIQLAPAVLGVAGWRGSG